MKFRNSFVRSARAIIIFYSTKIESAECGCRRSRFAAMAQIISIRTIAPNVQSCRTTGGALGGVLVVDVIGDGRGRERSSKWRTPWRCRKILRFILSAISPISDHIAELSAVGDGRLPGDTLKCRLPPKLAAGKEKYAIGFKCKSGVIFVKRC